jgi:hypothetical protein
VCGGWSEQEALHSGYCWYAQWGMNTWGIFIRMIFVQFIGFHYILCCLKFLALIFVGKNR